MSWSNEAHVERLKVLWGNGLSASQVAASLAKEFPDAKYSRNAVIGKVHRLGLSGRGKSSAPVRFQAPKRVRPIRRDLTGLRISDVRNPTERMALPAVANAEARLRPAPEVVARARAFVPLDGRKGVPFGSPGCRWPVGGEGADMMCCGANRVEPAQERPSPSYCVEHAAIAYKKPKAGAPKNAREMFRALRRYAA